MDTQPAEARMSREDLKDVAEELGLDRDAIRTLFGVEKTTVDAWFWPARTIPVPHRVAARLRAMLAAKREGRAPEEENAPPMWPEELEGCLRDLRWEAHYLARVLGVHTSTVRRWLDPGKRIPMAPDVADWLRRLAAFVRANPPPPPPGKGWGGRPTNVSLHAREAGGGP